MTDKFQKSAPIEPVSQTWIVRTVAPNTVEIFHVGVSDAAKLANALDALEKAFPKSISIGDARGFPCGVRVTPITNDAAQTVLAKILNAS